jgi:Na+-translocating ferredoxin:NAD+ oxidoreductase RnfG subunit
MQLFNNIANKCFCHLLGVVILQVMATNSSEMAATIYKLTQRHIQEDMNCEQG